MGGASLSTSGNRRITSGSTITGFSSGLYRSKDCVSADVQAIYTVLLVLQFFKNLDSHLCLASTFCIIAPPINKFLKNIYK